MSPSVSVKSLRDADAIYAQLNKVKINDFISVKKVKIQPGVVFLSYYPLVDGISWESMAPIMLLGDNSI